MRTRSVTTGRKIAAVGGIANGRDRTKICVREEDERTLREWRHHE